jgi:hypothetical protein
LAPPPFRGTRHGSPAVVPGHSPDTYLHATMASCSPLSLPPRARPLWRAQVCQHLPYLPRLIQGARCPVPSPGQVTANLAAEQPSDIVAAQVRRCVLISTGLSLSAVTSRRVCFRQRNPLHEDLRQITTASGSGSLDDGTQPSKGLRRQRGGSLPGGGQFGPDHLNAQVATPNLNCLLAGKVRFNLPRYKAGEGRVTLRSALGVDTTAGQV